MQYTENNNKIMNQTLSKLLTSAVCICGSSNKRYTVYGDMPKIFNTSIMV